MIERDVAAARQVDLLAALLDHATPPWDGGVLPPLGHWLHFPPAVRQSGIGADGHARREPGSPPRRMWAGSRMRIHRPVPLGATMERRTDPADPVEKVGRTGRLQFVTLRHAISVDGRLAIEEEQDLVYRDAVTARPGAVASPVRAAPVPPIVRAFSADPVQLFRYSALTFNGHRIHYDRRYAIDVEGYPGLVVHGPYLATLLLDLFLRERPRARVSGFSFRALRPVFDAETVMLGLSLAADGAELICIKPDGGAAVEARVIAA